jgi:UDP-N-acetylmuramyl pentapeptide phosphotransferase/UDP-N-acetylglucosamine-1-phosphate transferase
MASYTLSGGVLAAVFLCGLVLATGVIGLLLATKLAWRIATDLPNDRSLHTRPIPRVGGWGVVPAALITAILFGVADTLLVCVLTVLFIVSYADDRFSLPVLVRMTIHGTAAALWLSQGPIALPTGTAILAGCGIVWITNLFNFMDGSDGLAGGMAVFAFGTFGAVAAASGVTPLAMWSIAFAGAVGGFLFFNFNPAMVFLGDAGSITLGFLAGVFGIWGWASGIWPFWFPFLVSAPFFVDATVTLFRRVVRGDPFWKAHREHYYQRLIRMGWSHSRTALCEYLLMAACSVLAIAMLEWPHQAQMIGLGSAALVFLAIGYAVDHHWLRFVALQPQVLAVQPRVAPLWRRGRHRHVVVPAPVHTSVEDPSSAGRRTVVVSERPDFRLEQRQMRQGHSGDHPAQDS